MKKYYVYEIVNLMGTIEYVGETTMPKRRLWNHTSNGNGSGSGRFNNRSDIFMNIVAEFDNRKDAFNYQCKLQYEYGFETDADKRQKFVNPNGAPKIPIIVFNRNGKFIGEYDSVSIAASILDVKQPSISRVLAGNRKYSKGYTFEYKIVK